MLRLLRRFCALCTIEVIGGGKNTALTGSLAADAALTTLIGPRSRFITGRRDRQWRLGESQGRSACADRCAGCALTHQGRAFIE